MNKHSLVWCFSLPHRVALHISLQNKPIVRAVEGNKHSLVPCVLMCFDRVRGCTPHVIAVCRQCTSHPHHKLSPFFFSWQEPLPHKSFPFPPFLIASVTPTKSVKEEEEEKEEH